LANQISASLFAGIAILGVVDAQVRFVPETRRVQSRSRDSDAPGPELSLSLGFGAGRLRLSF
jgi:hypothetical protein